jgi:hypothetical protein
MPPSLYLGAPTRHAGAFQNACHHMLVNGLVSEGVEGM